MSKIPQRPLDDLIKELFESTPKSDWYNNPCGYLFKPNHKREEQLKDKIHDDKLKFSWKRAIIGSIPYKKRWFQLDTQSKVLRYYKTSDDNIKLGEINLNYIIDVIYSKVYDADEFTLDLVSNEKHYTVRASSMNEMVQWAYVLSSYSKTFINKFEKWFLNDITLSEYDTQRYIKILIANKVFTVNELKNILQSNRMLLNNFKFDIPHIAMIKEKLKHVASIDEEKQFLEACSRNDIQEMMNILLDCKNEIINCSDSTLYNTPLLIASKEGFYEIAQFLISLGANVHEKNKKGNTSLILASGRGYYNIVELLLQNNADVHDQNTSYNNYTALLYASRNGHYDVVKLLLSYGANVNQFDYFHSSSLLVAATYGHFTVVELLLQNQANVNDRDNLECSPIIRATINGYYKIVELLMNYGANMNDEDDNSQSSVIYAIKFGHHDIVNLFIQRGLVVSEPLPNGSDYPIVLASQEGHLEVVQLLLQYGATVYDVNTQGNTSLLAATNRSSGIHLRIIQYLILQGADIYFKNMFTGYTPILHTCASDYDNDKIVELLFTSGANLTDRNLNAQTCLMIAAEKGNFYICKILLARGANIYDKDKDGRSAADYAGKLPAWNVNRGKILDLFKRFSN